MRGRVSAPGHDLRDFTPEGERAWAGAGWDPVYPAGDGTLEPGAVFLAAGAVWVVADVAPDRVRYVRVTPGERAGTVEVVRRDERTVEVTYDLTALDPGAARALQAFAEGYPAMLEGWTRAIAAAAT
jgi:hypothetical protein